MKFPYIYRILKKKTVDWKHKTDMKKRNFSRKVFKWSADNKGIIHKALDSLLPAMKSTDITTQF